MTDILANIRAVMAGMVPRVIVKLTGKLQKYMTVSFGDILQVEFSRRH